jgi:hypothetical protein
MTDPGPAAEARSSQRASEPGRPGHWPRLGARSQARHYAYVGWAGLGRAGRAEFTVFDTADVLKIDETMHHLPYASTSAPASTL